MVSQQLVSCMFYKKSVSELRGHCWYLLLHRNDINNELIVQEHPVNSRLCLLEVLLMPEADLAVLPAQPRRHTEHQCGVCDFIPSG